MSPLTYEYKTSQVLMAFAYSVLGTHSFFTLIQKIRYINQPKTALMFVIMSSVLLSTLSVWTAHFLLTFALVVGNNLPLYVDVKLTLISLVVAIVFNTVGFYISFFGFMKRVSTDYHIEIKNEDKKVNNNIEMVTDNLVVHPVVQRSETNLNKDKITYVDFCLFFEKQKLKKSDWVCIFIGGIFIAPSTILTHVVGMMAIKFQGDVSMMAGHQIWLSMVGAVACCIFNIAFFYKDSQLMRWGLTFILTIVIFVLHFFSIYFTNFYDTNSTHNLETDGNLLDLNDCSKLLFVIGGVISYVFKEVSTYCLNNSPMIYKLVGNYVNKNINFIQMTSFLDYVEQENIKKQEQEHNLVNKPIPMVYQNSTIKGLKLESENLTNISILNVSNNMKREKKTKSLFEQLGEEIINKAVEKCVYGMVQDSEFSFTLKDIDIEKLIHYKTNFFISIFGGPTPYNDKDFEEIITNIKNFNFNFEGYKNFIANSFSDLGATGKQITEIMSIVEAMRNMLTTYENSSIRKK